MRSPTLLLITGLIVMTTFSQFLSASDSCYEEVARLRKMESHLKGQLQKQEFLLRTLLNQPESMKKTKVEQNQDTQHTDCSNIFSSGSKSSGVYKIKLNGNPPPVKVYCDMSDGGGWTIVQRRINGTEKFNRSWAEYKNGFGELSGEFWLGNDNLHYITSQGNYSLRIYLEDFEGNQRYAEYKNFKVTNEKDHYRLSFGAYVGTAGDALSGGHQVGVSEWASHQGMRFSTYDQDNDIYRGNCAQEDKGGWWFNNSSTDDGVVWYTWRGWWYSLKTTIMKLRPIT
ncbi:unnamed protein product, partial [Menidia menidia]